MHLIVGLGNPGKRYEKTRHNVGFMAVDLLHRSLDNAGVSAWELSSKFNAAIAGGTVNGTKIILAKPMTFMNSSGEAVQLIAHYYKIPAKDIIVVHDDKDLQLGEYKIQKNRGHAGHNGVRSITELIGSADYTRVRIGIASANNKKMTDVPAFVLEKFGLLERKKIQTILEKTITELKTLIGA